MKTVPANTALPRPCAARRCLAPYRGRGQKTGQRRARCIKAQAHPALRQATGPAGTCATARLPCAAARPGSSGSPACMGHAAKLTVPACVSASPDGVSPGGKPTDRRAMRTGAPAQPSLWQAAPPHHPKAQRPAHGNTMHRPQNTSAVCKARLSAAVRQRPQQASALMLARGGWLITSRKPVLVSLRSPHLSLALPAGNRRASNLKPPGLLLG